MKFLFAILGSLTFAFIFIGSANAMCVAPSSESGLNTVCNDHFIAPTEIKKRVFEGQTYILSQINNKAYSGKDVTISWDMYNRMSISICNTISLKSLYLQPGRSRIISQKGASFYMLTSCNNEQIDILEINFRENLENGIRVTRSQAGDMLTLSMKNGTRLQFTLLDAVME